jgi:DNA-binding CsgD family transcriptional regulator
MRAVEFYTDPDGDVILRGAGTVAHVYTESDTEFTSSVLSVVREFYPDAHAALEGIYSKSRPNRRYFEFLLVRRFLKCNFSPLDNRIDFDSGYFQFEFVPCPMRGECPFCNVICNPKFNSNLSERELQIYRMIVDGLEAADIARELYLSIHTVNNHRRNILRRLSLHSIPELVDYWHRNHLK